MFLSVASKLLAVILTALLFCSIIVAVMYQTLLNSHYLQNQFQAVNGYQRLSSGIATELAQTPELAIVPDASTKINAIITPEVVKAKLNPALDQLQAYYKGDGPMPVIDFTDIGNQAKAAGLPIDPNGNLGKPIVLGSNNADTIHANDGAYKKVLFYSATASGVFALLLIIVSLRRKRYTPLPNVLIAVALFVGVIAIVLYGAPILTDRAIRFSTSSSAFVSLGHDLVREVMHDLAKRYGIAAGALLAVGIVARVIAKKAQITTMPSNHTVIPTAQAH